MRARAMTRVIRLSDWGTLISKQRFGAPLLRAGWLVWASAHVSIGAAGPLNAQTRLGLVEADIKIHKKHNTTGNMALC